MNNYLSAVELAALVGCQQNSYACMRRWLERGKWPFEKSISGFPKVSRSYHDARMSGANPAQIKTEGRVAPNFSALARTA